MRKLNTVLIGFGNIAAGYASDPKMTRFMEYSTHAQVLKAHQAFDWKAVVDISENALKNARENWGIPFTATTINELPNSFHPEVAVIATPPSDRLDILKKMSNIRAVLVEKPLGTTLQEAREFTDYCKQNDIHVQVNYLRRGDHTFRSFAAGELLKRLGNPQAAFGIYTNGLINNGSHLIDWFRMFFGEITSVQSAAHTSPINEGPIPDDQNIPFIMTTQNGLPIMIQPVSVNHYRELGMDIWGEKGRLSIMHSGLTIKLFYKSQHRSLSDGFEITDMDPLIFPSTIGQALYNMYSNLADCIQNNNKLWSTAGSAIQSMKIIEAIFTSAQENGKTVDIS